MPLHAFERAVERAQAVGAGVVRPRLHVRLVDLDDVGAGGEEVADLAVHGLRVIHRRELAAAAVVLDLRLLGHRERTGHGHLDGAVGVPAQEQQVVDLAPDGGAGSADDARHGVRMAAAIERHARVVDVDAIERGGEAVRIAFAADFAVGDDVEPGRFLGADGEHRCIVLCLGEQRLRYAPQLARAYARRKTLREPRAVDEPLGLRIAADEGGGEKHALTPPATARRARARRGSMRRARRAAAPSVRDFSRWPSNWMGGRTAACAAVCALDRHHDPEMAHLRVLDDLVDRVDRRERHVVLAQALGPVRERMLGEVPAELPARAPRSSRSAPAACRSAGRAPAAPNRSRS